MKTTLSFQTIADKFGFGSQGGGAAEKQERSTMRYKSYKVGKRARAKSSTPGAIQAQSGIDNSTQGL